MPNPTIIGAGMSAAGGLIGTIVNAIQNKNSLDRYYAWERYKHQENSIPSQMAQWKAAGLNPNSFGGNSVPVQGTPPQPNSLGNSIASSMQSAGNLWQQRQIAKLNNDVQQSKLELERQSLEIQKGDAQMRKEMHQWNIKKAQQAWNRGEYGLAMDILNYNFAFATHDDKVQMFHNERSISDTYQKNYREYLAALIQNKIENNKSLLHSRQIADQRYALDVLKHSDDMFYREMSLDALNDHRAGQLSLARRRLSIDERRLKNDENYHKNYLEFLRMQNNLKYQLGLIDAIPSPEGISIPKTKKPKSRFKLKF